MTVIKRAFAMPSCMISLNALMKNVLLSMACIAPFGEAILDRLVPLVAFTTWHCSLQHNPVNQSMKYTFPIESPYTVLPRMSILSNSIGSQAVKTPMIPTARICKSICRISLHTVVRAVHVSYCIHYSTRTTQIVACRLQLEHQHCICYYRTNNLQQQEQQ